MLIESAAVIYFSPTGSTKKIANSIVKGMNLNHVEYIDITKPSERMKERSEINEDLLIFGFPVYEEYAPSLFIDYIKKIKYKNQAAIAFSVYGNIGFGLSLKQIYKELTAKHLTVIALGAFIGEHSFATDAAPLAIGKPNQKDLVEAETFGITIKEQLLNNHRIIAIDEQVIPGKLPMMARILPPNSAKIFTKPPNISSLCNNCKICIMKCPQGAIDNNLIVDDSKCIRCFACVKYCTKKARLIEYKKKDYCN